MSSRAAPARLHRRRTVRAGHPRTHPRRVRTVGDAAVRTVVKVEETVSSAGGKGVRRGQGYGERPFESVIAARSRYVAPCGHVGCEGDAGSEAVRTRKHEGGGVKRPTPWAERPGHVRCGWPRLPSSCSRRGQVRSCTRRRCRVSSSGAREPGAAKSRFRPLRTAVVYLPSPFVGPSPLGSLQRDFGDVGVRSLRCRTVSRLPPLDTRHHRRVLERERGAAGPGPGARWPDQYDRQVRSNACMAPVARALRCRRRSCRRADRPLARRSAAGGVRSRTAWRARRGAAA